MAGLYSNYASASPTDIQRKREIAQRLLMNAQQTQPQTIGEGLGAVGDYIYAGRVGKAAEAGDKELRGKGNAMLQALLGGGMQQEAPATPQPSLAPQGVNVAQIAPPAGAQGGNLPGTMPQVAPMQPEMTQQQMPQQQPKKGRFMFADVDTERLIELSMDPNVNQTLEYIGAGSVLKMANDEIKRRWDYMTEQEKQEFQRNLKEREIAAGRETTAGEQGFDSFDEMQQGGGTWKSRQERRSFTDPGGVKFDEQVAAKIAENVPKYISVGENARSMNADLEVMRDIMTSIETGGLKGKALTMFPSLDEASQFIDARVNYWAPRMRVEGSGSTSDLEVGMMVNSWPSLKNSQEANKLVIQMMMRKNAIDSERGKIATMMAANQMDRREGMMRLMQLDQQSVMTPELDKMIRGVVDNSGMKQQPQQQNPQLEDALRKYGNGGTY